MTTLAAPLPGPSNSPLSAFALGSNDQEKGNAEVEQLALDMSLGGSANHFCLCLRPGTGMPTPHVSPWRKNTPGPHSSSYRLVWEKEREGVLGSAASLGFLCGRWPVHRTHVSCLSLPWKGPLSGAGAGVMLRVVQLCWELVNNELNSGARISKPSWLQL